MYDGDFSLVPQVFDGPHAGVEPVVIIQRNGALLGDADIRAVVDVQRVVVGHNAIQVVVATRKLHHYQFAVLAIAAHKVRSSCLIPLSLNG